MNVCVNVTHVLSIWFVQDVTLYLTIFCIILHPQFSIQSMTPIYDMFFRCNILLHVCVYCIVYTEYILYIYIYNYIHIKLQYIHVYTYIISIECTYICIYIYMNMYKYIVYIFIHIYLHMSMIHMIWYLYVYMYMQRCVSFYAIHFYSQVHRVGDPRRVIVGGQSQGCCVTWAETWAWLELGQLWITEMVNHSIPSGKLT